MSPHLNLMELETVTTVPVLPLEHPAFIEEVLQDRPRSHRKAERLPAWASVCLYIGGALCLGVGAFFLTYGFLQAGTWSW